MCSVKYIRSWSHASWVTNYKRFIENILPVGPKALTKRRRRIINQEIGDNLRIYVLNLFTKVNTLPSLVAIRLVKLDI